MTGLRRTVRSTAAPLGAALLSLACAAAWAGSFAVTPIRLELSPTVRTGAITVVNSDQVPLGFQVKLLRWTQNAKGEDLYEDSKALTFFPRLMTLEPGARRVIRVGTQTAAEDTEVAYRLAIDEMPPPRQPGSGATVAVKVRFAVPIFTAPKQPRISVEVLDLAVRGGELRFKLANRGNQHVKLEDLLLLRGERQVASGHGWYVLPGAQREFAIKADAACGKPDPAFLVLKGEGVDVRRDVSSLLSRCGQ